MIKNRLFLLWLTFVPLLGLGASKKQVTTLNCQVFNFGGEMIYFNCMQDNRIRAEFHSNPGEDHTCSFETDRMVTMLVNGTEFLLEPGDSLCAIIRYNDEGRRVSTIAFSGTKQAVIQNQTLRRIEEFRSSIRYKSQLLACAVVEIKPADRIADSKKFLDKANEIIRATASQTSEEFRNYAAANVEAMAYLSLIEYPPMYADIRKVAIEEQGIGDYWHLADGITLRSDDASLSCYAYCNFLMRYCDFSGHKAAHESGTEYKRPNTLEEIYAQLASFYKGPIRDATIFSLLANYIQQGQKIERAEVLLKDYSKKYNKNKLYLAYLDQMMQ